MVLSRCSKCEKKTSSTCGKSQIELCLKTSECDICNCTTYYLTIGKFGRRHCTRCGAVWPVNRL